MKDDVKDVLTNAPDVAKETFRKMISMNRKYNAFLDVESLIREGKAEQIKLPEDPEEAKELLTATLLEMKDKFNQAIEAARQFPEGEKPFLMGLTSPGKSNKVLSEIISETKKKGTDNHTK